MRPTANGAQSPISESQPTLPDRDAEVLRKIAQGCTNDEIATALFLSAHTVKSRVERLLRKLRAGNRANAVFLGARAGSLDTELGVGGETLYRPPPAVILSQRERQILVGMARGQSNKAIGRELHLAEDTVKTHLRRLFRNLEANGRANMVFQGIRAGLLNAELGGSPAQLAARRVASAAAPVASPRVGSAAAPVASVVLTDTDTDTERLRQVMFPRLHGDTLHHARARCREAIRVLAAQPTPPVATPPPGPRIKSGALTNGPARGRAGSGSAPGPRR